MAIRPVTARSWRLCVMRYTSVIPLGSSTRQRAAEASPTADVPREGVTQAGVDERVDPLEDPPIGTLPELEALPGGGVPDQVHSFVLTRAAGAVEAREARSCRPGHVTRP